MYLLPFVFVGGHSTLPVIHGNQYFVSLLPVAPDRFTLFQTDFVMSLMQTIVMAAKVRYFCYPHDTI